MTFSFTRDGIEYRIHTEVGNGPTDVVIQESKPDETPMEQSE